MLNQKIILVLGLTLMLGACTTADGVLRDINGMFTRKAWQTDMAYLDPLPEESRMAGDTGRVAAPRKDKSRDVPVTPGTQVDLSYNRVASELSSSSVEMFSLDTPGLPVQAPRYNPGSRRSVVASGPSAVSGVPSSTDPSVMVFPFTNDMYTPGIKPGLPGFRSARSYDYAGAGPVGASVEALPLYTENPNLIYFAHGSAALSATAQQVIASVAASQPAGLITVEGHASHRAAVKDPQQRVEVNYRMSMKRAMAVTKALIKKGIPPEMIKTTALGDTSPAVPEVDKDSEALNRRVAIRMRP